MGPTSEIRTGAVVVIASFPLFAVFGGVPTPALLRLSKVSSTPAGDATVRVDQPLCFRKGCPRGLHRVA